MSMTASVENLIRVAQGQVGYTEQGGRDGKSGNLTKFGKAYGLDGYAWCSIFVWWCFMQIGVDVRHVVTGNYAGADAAMQGFKAKGWRIVKGPRRGDVYFCNFDADPDADHTGIVVSVDAHGVWGIEGNTSSGNTGSQADGGGVHLRYRPYSVIIGYGRYPFPTPSTPAPHTTKPVTPSKSYPTLKQGSVGNDVARLQGLLHIAADGKYGPKTEKAVLAYQKRKGLQQDGVAGPATLKTLGW